MPRVCSWVSRSKRWPSAPAFVATQSANGKRPATPFPGRCTRTLCRVVDILEGKGARFTADAVSTLSGDSPLSNGSGTSRHQLRTIARVYISVWIWLLGVRHAGVSRARHEQESQSARVLQWFAARPPSDEHFHSFRTLTDEFAFRRISRFDVRVRPIQIEHHWRDSAASAPPPPCADYLAVTKAQD